MAVSLAALYELRRDASGCHDAEALGRALIAQGATQPTPLLRQRTPGQPLVTVRVFLSSTFKDFRRERAIINKVLLPSLELHCRRKGLELSLVDLQWGVPSGASAADTVRFCMGELDRCAAANGRPFFVYMGGQRFGWVPTIADSSDSAPSAAVLPAEVAQQYDWVGGASVTTMEVLQGALRSRNPHALLFLRDPAFIDSVPEAERGEYLDSEGGRPSATAYAMQAALVRAIRAVMPPEAVVDYLPLPLASLPHASSAADDSAEPSSAAETSGDLSSRAAEAAAVGLGTPVPVSQQSAAISGGFDYSLFQETLRSSLLSLIDAAYPVPPDVAPPLSLRGLHEQHRSLGRSLRESSTAVDRAAAADAFLSSLRCPPRSRVVVLSGPSGTGKSSMLAFAAAAAEGWGWATVAHFAGRGERASDVAVLSRRIVGELRAIASACSAAGAAGAVMNTAAAPASAEVDDYAARRQAALARLDTANTALVPSDASKACCAAAHQLKCGIAAAAAAGMHVLLVIDAIDHLQGADELQWLPDCVGEGLVVLLSTTSGAQVATIRSRCSDAHVIEMPQLHEAERQQMVCALLAHHHKSMPSDHIARLCSNAGAGSPLWLRVALQHLRLRAVFETVDAMLTALPPDVFSLLQLELEASLAVVDRSSAKALLLLMCVSRHGLLQSEIALLLPVLVQALENSTQATARVGELHGSKLEPLPTLALLQLMSPLSWLFAQDNGPVVSFCHAQIQAAVRAAVCASQHEVAAAQAVIAAVFTSGHHSLFPRRAVGEAAWQLRALRRYDELLTVLASDAALLHVWGGDECDVFEALRWCREAAGGQGALAIPEAGSATAGSPGKGAADSSGLTAEDSGSGSAATPQVSAERSGVVFARSDGVGAALTATQTGLTDSGASAAPANPASTPATTQEPALEAEREGSYADCAAPLFQRLFEKLACEFLEAFVPCSAAAARGAGAAITDPELMALACTTFQLHLQPQDRVCALDGLLQAAGVLQRMGSLARVRASLEAVHRCLSRRLDRDSPDDSACTCVAAGGAGAAAAHGSDGASGSHDGLSADGPSCCLMGHCAQLQLRAAAVRLTILLADAATELGDYRLSERHYKAALAMQTAADERSRGTFVPLASVSREAVAKSLLGVGLALFNHAQIVRPNSEPLENASRWYNAQIRMLLTGSADVPVERSSDSAPAAAAVTAAACAGGGAAGCAVPAIPAQAAEDWAVCETLASAVHELGSVRRLQRRFDEAVSHFELALQLRLRCLGEEHPATALTLHDLGSTLSRTGVPANVERALLLIEKAMRVRIKSLGYLSAEVAFSAGDIGNALMRLGRCEEAIPHYLQVADIRAKILPPLHPHHAWTWIDLSAAYFACERWADYVRANELAGSVLRAVHGNNSKVVATNWQCLAVGWAKLQQPEKAAAAAESAITALAAAGFAEEAINLRERYHDGMRGFATRC